MKNVRLTVFNYTKELFSKKKSYKINLKELRQKYESKYKKKYSERTYRRVAHSLANLGYFKLIRSESLWMVKAPITEINGHQSDIDSKHTLTESKPQLYPKIHSAHKIKLGISYKGTQPQEDADNVKPFGRYKTATQSIYKLTNRITIIAYKKRINVWVHKPAGTLTKEQLINAKTEAFINILKFCKDHKLVITSDLTKVLQSHHVVEDKEINEIFKPLIEKYEDIIDEQMGVKVCKTSHKDKIEEEGRVRPDRLVKGHKIAEGLEWLVLDAKGYFQRNQEREKKYSEKIEMWGAKAELYGQEIQEHREAIKNLKTATKKLREVLEKVEKKL